MVSILIFFKCIKNLFLLFGIKYKNIYYKKIYNIQKYKNIQHRIIYNNYLLYSIYLIIVNTFIYIKVTI